MSIYYEWYGSSHAHVRTLSPIHRARVRGTAYGEVAVGVHRRSHLMQVRKENIQMPSAKR